MELVVKNVPAYERDIREVRLLPGPGISPGRGTATYSSILAWRLLMDRGAWWATVHEVAKSGTRLSE